MDEPNYLFMLEILDGYSFRNLIEYLAYTIKEGNFIFDKKTIEFRHGNSSGDLFNHVMIKTYKISNYIFNSENPVIIGVVLPELKAHTKNIVKKEGIRIFFIEGEDSLYIQGINNGKGSTRNNYTSIKIKTINDEEVYPPKLNRPFDDPNAVINVTEFAKTCKTITSSCEHIKFYGYSKGFKMDAFGEGGYIEKFEYYGKCDETPLTRIITVDKKLKLIKKPEKTIKITKKNVISLSKVNNTSQNGYGRVYIDKEEGIVAYKFPIGYYGSLFVYMIDTDEVNDTRED